jgi:ActR/RegA family two-component response regulator
MAISRRSLLSSAVLGLSLVTGFSGSAAAAETIKVGILHSLSGTMAISETSSILLPTGHCSLKRHAS